MWLVSPGSQLLPVAQTLLHGSRASAFMLQDRSASAAAEQRHRHEIAELQTRTRDLEAQLATAQNEVLPVKLPATTDIPADPVQVYAWH